VSRDYFVLWTDDNPTPKALGLGSALLPWPAAHRRWPRDAAARQKLGYPRTRDSLDWVLVHSTVTDRESELPESVVTALAKRAVVRRMIVQNDFEFACDLAEAGAGVCFDEEGEVLIPSEARTCDPARGRRTAAARIWTSANRRPDASFEAIVEAAADADETALAILRAWAPDSYAMPNKGVRHMNHDRPLLELVWKLAQERPSDASPLLRVLVWFSYFPAARHPGFAAVAKAAAFAGAEAFIAEAAADAHERQKWFGMREPLD
jgi:hypothetical protein